MYFVCFCDAWIRHQESLRVFGMFVGLQHIANTERIKILIFLGMVECSLLAASPEDGDPPGLSLAEVPGLLGPMVPRDQTIVVSVQNNLHETFLTSSRNLSQNLSRKLTFLLLNHFSSTK